MTAAPLERLDRLEREVERLRAELRAVRLELAPQVRAEPSPGPLRPASPLPRVQPAFPTALPPSPRAPRRDLRELVERFGLTGGRGLALAGGVVTLLGVVFLFVLAADRGWIGPVERVALGAGASLAVFAAGLVVHRRHGNLHAAVAAAGAGVAGGYATIVAAAAIYELVPIWGALLLAAAVALVGGAVAVAWSSEPLATLALVGTVVLPLLHQLEESFAAGATAFVCVVLAAATVVGVARGWRLLHAGAAAAAALDAVLLVREAEAPAGWELGVVLAVAGVLLAGAVARDLRSGIDSDPLVSVLVLGSAALGLGALLELLGDETHRGLGLLAAACAFAAVAVSRLRRAELATVAGAAALVLAAVGTAALVGAAGLAVVWGLESVALTLAGARLADARLRLSGLVYGVAAAVQALAVDGALRPFFDAEAADDLVGVPGLSAVAAAALAAAVLPARPRRRGAGGLAGVLDAVWAELASIGPALTAVFGLAAGAAAVGALGLVLADVSFAWGHVATTVVAAAVGLAATAAAARARADALTAGSLAGLAAVLALAVGFDWNELGGRYGAWSTLVAGTAILLATYAARALGDGRARTAVAGVGSAVALLCALASIGELTPSWLAASPWLFVVSTAYGALAAAALRRAGGRDLATVTWAHGLVALAIAEAALAQGRVVVLFYAATGIALALLARTLDERRLLAGAATYVASATAGTLVLLTPPDRLFIASDHPGEALWLLAACVVGVAVLAWALPRRRVAIGCAAAVLALYALSLGILQLASVVSTAAIETDFERGHTVVSAVWALLGLGLLHGGLLRRVRAVRLAGLALLGVSLAKIFLYDLAELSSVARAASFMAVGAALLAGGFVVQRLSARL